MNAISVGAVSLGLFLFFQARGIPTGDSGDLVTAAATFGVAHPPGYPLYVFLGWILTKIPVFTVSWRVALLSSVPHALVVGLVYAIVLRVTKQKISALFAGMVLAGNYLFFLYSTTPEVFALLDLFVAVFLWIILISEDTRTSGLLYVASFIFGLALTHHHMIIFMIPALFFAFRSLYVSTHLKRHRVVMLLKCLLWFGIGIIPYGYIYFAANGSSIINWDHATNWLNFVRLLTRADYGTFQSGAVIGQHPIARFFQIRALAHYIFLDFGLAGIVLFFVGMWRLWSRHKRISIIFFLGILFLGPLFFFYASYPMANRFTLATFERFLLPVYVCIAIYIGIGHAGFVTMFTSKLSKITRHIPKKALVVCIVSVLFLYPLVSGGVTIWRFRGMSTDRTAEQFALDVFTDIPRDSILILDRDTTLFTTQYIRYGLGIRPDIPLFHGSFISSKTYQMTMKKVFPGLFYPEKPEESYLSEFLITNAQKRHVFSNVQYPVPEHWFWVPYGLLYKLTPEDQLPQISKIEDLNNGVWGKMHDPTVGILSRYNHLMLSDVRDVYASSRLSYGRMLLKAGRLESAKKQFQEAIRLGGDTQISDAFMYLGLTQLFLGECDAALTSFQSARSTPLVANSELTLYEAITLRDCAKDSKRAQELFSQYEALRQQSEQPLQGL